jgi:hypothetical protein
MREIRATDRDRVPGNQPAGPEPNIIALKIRHLPAPQRLPPPPIPVGRRDIKKMIVLTHILRLH